MNRQVLIVDHDRTSSEPLRLTLLEEGYGPVGTAETALLAERGLEEGLVPGVILVDLGTETGGRDLLQWVSERTALGAVPVIALSRDPGADQVLVTTGRVRDLVAKPIDVDRLLGALGRCRLATMTTSS